jgi:hypothetical protein
MLRWTSLSPIAGKYLASGQWAAQQFFCGGQISALADRASEHAPDNATVEVPAVSYDRLAADAVEIWIAERTKLIEDPTLPGYLEKEKRRTSWVQRLWRGFRAIANERLQAAVAGSALREMLMLQLSLSGEWQQTGCAVHRCMLLMETFSKTR